MRITGPLLKVLRVLDESAPEPAYGLEILRKTGLSSGTLYPILDRLAAEGWVIGKWEPDDASPKGPRRRFYGFTRKGSIEVRNILLEYGMAMDLRWA
jgi:PadR family transcriptional regulator PadR